MIDQNRALAGGVTPGDGPGFPITISQPGSYRLDGNLTVPDANTTAISITSSNVTLDLNGYSILGATVCSGTVTTTSCSPLGGGRGVLTLDSVRNIWIKNGTISGMGNNGLLLPNIGSNVVDVRVQSNGNEGMNVQSGIVRGSTAENNGSTGMFLNAITAIGNFVSGNKGAGIIFMCPGTAVDNTSMANGGANFSTSGPNCAVANNSAP